MLMSMALSACTAEVYSDRGNASVLSSKNLDQNTVELTVAKDNGEIVTIVRQYDSRTVVGARLIVDDAQSKDDSVKTVHRYEFK